MSTQRRIHILVGLVLALIVPTASLFYHIPIAPGIERMLAREGIWWGLFALVLLYVFLVERRPLSSLGLHRPGWRTFVYGAILGTVLFVLNTILAHILVHSFPPHINVTSMLALLHAPFWLRLLVVTRAAVIEETLFRGYGIERLQELTGNRWIAGGVTLAIFAMVHYLSGGWIHVVTAGWAGLVLTVFYFWRRDLGVNIVAHWVLDGLGFLVLAQIIR